MHNGRDQAEILSIMHTMTLQELVWCYNMSGVSSYTV